MPKKIKESAPVEKVEEIKEVKEVKEKKPHAPSKYNQFVADRMKTMNLKGAQRSQITEAFKTIAKEWKETKNK